MSGTCETCRHWKPPSERVEYRGAVAAFDDWSVDFDERERLTDEADRKFGECGGVPFAPTANDVLAATGPQATIRDGSDYFAALYTTADFGCALWAAKDET